MNSEVAEFIIYIINEVAYSNGLYPSQVYKAMDKTGCIRNYLVPFYDVLHTMGIQSLTCDVIEYMEQRGTTICIAITKPLECNNMNDEEMEKIYREYLEENIVKCLAERQNISLEEALHRYYTSHLADRIHEGRFGIQYLDYRLLTQYLEEELQKNNTQPASPATGSLCNVSSSPINKKDTTIE